MRELLVESGDVRLGVEEQAGPGSAIVFLHFGGGNLAMWRKAVSHFAGRHRLVLVDLRGHGRSDRPTGGYDIDTMATDVVGVLQALGIQNYHLVGSSLGAEVALALAANHPGKALSVSLDGASSSEYGPFSTWDGSAVEFEEHAARIIAKLRAREPRTFPSSQAAVEWERGKYEASGFWNDAFEQMIRYGLREVSPGQYAYGWPDWLPEYMANYFRCRFEDYYRRVQCPALLLVSAEDLEDQRQQAIVAGLAALAKHGSVAAIPGWVHPYGWLLDPTPACEAVLAFLARLPDPAEHN